MENVDMKALGGFRSMLKAGGICNEGWITIQSSMVLITADMY
jgi:hypothetical protein